jgi:hypothetical protein
VTVNKAPLRGAPEDESLPPPKGLGGFMVIVIGALFLGLADAALFLARQTLPMLGPNYGAEWPAWFQAMNRWWVYSAAVGAAWLIGLLALAFLKKRIFPKAALGFVAYRFCAALVTSVWVMVLDPETIPQEWRDNYVFWSAKEQGSYILGAIILCAFAAGYLLRSERVKNTFAEPLFGGRRRAG